MEALLKEYTAEVRRYATVVGRQLDTRAFCLMLEAAEIGNEIKRIDTKDKGVLTKDRRELIQEEMGDLMFFFVLIADHLHLSLADIIQANRAKLERLHAEREHRDDHGYYSPVPDVRGYN